MNIGVQSIPPWVTPQLPQMIQPHPFMPPIQIPTPRSQRTPNVTLNALLQPQNWTGHTQNSNLQLPATGSNRSSIRRPASSHHSFPSNAHEAQFIQAMNAVMPYLPHPSTGSHPGVSLRDVDNDELYKVTGGWSLPGKSPAGYTSVWPHDNWDIPIQIAPPLVPNPSDVNVPQIDWDFSKLPTTAQKPSGRDGRTMTPLGNAFDLSATYPPCNHLVVAVTFGILGSRWGPVTIQRNVVRVWDVLEALYEYLNTPLSPWEVYEIEQMQQAMNLPLETRLAAAASDRLKGSSDITARRGQNMSYRRVDCLGQRRYLWGMWLGFTADEAWYLNLGTRAKYVRPKRPPVASRRTSRPMTTNRCI